MGCNRLVLEIVPLFQQSATFSGTGPHCLPNSHLWLQEVASARQRPHPGLLRWLAG